MAYRSLPERLKYLACSSNENKFLNSRALLIQRDLDSHFNTRLRRTINSSNVDSKSAGDADDSIFVLSTDWTSLTTINLVNEQGKDVASVSFSIGILAMDSDAKIQDSCLANAGE